MLHRISDLLLQRVKHSTKLSCTLQKTPVTIMCNSLNSTSEISSTGLCNMPTVMTKVGIPNLQESICGWNPGQVHCSFSNPPVCSILIFFVGLGLIFSPYMLVWLTQGDTF